MDESLNKIKEFESVLKKCIKAYFGTLLSENINSILDNNSYFDANNLSIFKTREELQGSILRKMLDDVINISYKKDENDIEYGKEIEDLIIEYYAKLISQNYKFSINEGIVDNNEFVKLLKDNLGNEFDKNMLNSNLSLILKNEGLKNIEEYLDKKKEMIIDKDDDITKQNNAIQEYTTSKGSIQFVYVNNKKYLKYIDEKNETHLVEVDEDSKVIDYYNDRIANLQSDATLDADIFYAELSDIIKEEKLHKTNDLKEENLNQSAISMINYADYNKEFNPGKNDVLHSDNGELHVVTETNDIIATNDKGNHIEGELIKNNTNGLNPITNATPQLTPEQIEELIIRYANGESLTHEEELLLLASSPDLLKKVQEEKGLEAGPKLSLNSNYTSGKVFNPYLYFLIGIGTVFIIILVLVLCNLD